MQSKKIKRIIYILLLIFASIFAQSFLYACENTHKEYEIVCTLFPQYDFCREILGKEDGIKLLLDYGKDAHSYELTLTDKKNIENSKAFFYIGGESEKWVNDVKNSTDLSTTKMICLSEGIDLIPIIHSDDISDNDNEHMHEQMFDEHIFLSLKNSIKMCENIYKTLCEIYPEKVDELTVNYDNYISKLTSLDTQYKETINKLKNKTMIMADRFPFIYTARDYGIECYAAFNGCSSDMEITIGKKLDLQKKYLELNLPGVFIIENGNKDLANSIMGSKGGKIYELHSCQSITKQESNEETYLTLMNRNLNVFKEGLTVVD